MRRLVRMRAPAAGVFASIVILALASGSCKTRSDQDQTSLKADSDSTYEFGGACGSAGSWTKAALEQANAIKTVILALRDDPKCSAVVNAVTEIDSAQQAMHPQGQQAGTMSRLMTIPKEISAIRTFMRSTGQDRKDLMELLTGRVAEDLQAQGKAMASPGAGGAAADGGKSNPLLPAAASNILNMEQRVRETADVGLDALNNFLTTVQTQDQCLVGKPAMLGPILISSIKMLGAFAGGEDALASKIGRVLNSVVKIMSDKKFDAALREIDKTELWVSMSCLLETTSTSYCSARDAYQLMQDTGKQTAQRILESRSEAKAKSNPLDGYYIMTRMLPQVTEWIQSVQAGVAPRLQSDANYQNLVQQIPSTLIQARNTLTGAVYSDKMTTYRTLSGLMAKKKAAFDLLVELSNRITNFRFDASGGQAAPNFFTLAIPNNYLPFYLIGFTVDQIPDKCNTAKYGAQAASPFEWLSNNGAFQDSVFGDPDRLVRVIGAQLDAVIDEGIRQGGIYFRDRLKLDPATLVDEAVIAPNSTGSVKDGLTSTSNYLLSLLKRISANRKVDPDAMVLVPGIIDTRERIVKVLKSFDLARQSGEDQLDQYLQTNGAAAGGVSHSVVANADPLKKLAATSLQDLAKSQPAGIPQELTFAPTELKELSAKNYIYNPQQIAQSYKDVLDSVYTEFDVMILRESFLISRLSTYVYFDFAERIRFGQDSGLDDMSRDLLAVADSYLMERLNLTLKSDITAMYQDLINAMTINTRNLEVLQPVFRDSLKSTISELTLRAQGTPVNGAILRADSVARSFADVSFANWIKNPGEPLTEQQAKIINVMDITSPLQPIRAFIRRSMNPDLYPMPSWWRGVSDKGFADNEFHSFALFRATLCMQTLALPQPEFFADVCKGAVLTSLFAQDNPSQAEAPNDKDRSDLTKLNLNYDTWLSEYRRVELGSSGTDAARAFQSRRICAVFNNARKNRLFWMNADKKDDQEMASYLQTLTKSH